MWNGSVRIARQILQKVEFLARQPYLVAAGDHAARREVDFQIVQVQRLLACFRRQRRAPQSSANARQQFLHAERLGDVIVGAGVQRSDLIFFQVADQRE